MTTPTLVCDKTAAKLAARQAARDQLAATEHAYLYLVSLPRDTRVAITGYRVPFDEGFVTTIQRDDRGERLEFAYIMVSDAKRPAVKVKVTVLALLSGSKRIAVKKAGWDGTFAPLAIKH
jgi:hypothetical protein